MVKDRVLQTGKSAKHLVRLSSVTPWKADHRARELPPSPYLLPIYLSIIYYLRSIDLSIIYLSFI